MALRIAVGTYDSKVIGVQLGEDAVQDAERGTAKKALRMKIAFASDGHTDTCVKALSSCSGRYLISGGNDEKIKIWDTRKMVEHGTLFQHNGAITSLEAISAQFALSCAQDGIILLWDTKKDWDCVARFKAHDGPVNMISAHRSRTVFMSVGRDCTLRIWDLQRGEVANSVKLENEPKMVQWSPSGARYAIGYADEVIIYDRNTKPQTKLGFESKLHCLVFLTDIIVATGWEDGVVRLFDVQTGEVLFELRHHSKRVRALDVFAAGSEEGAKGQSQTPWLVSASSDGMICTWSFNGAEPGDTIKPCAIAETGSRVTCMSVLERGRDFLRRATKSAPKLAPRGAGGKRNSAGNSSGGKGRRRQRDPEEIKRRKKQKREKKKRKQNLLVEVPQATGPSKSRVVDGSSQPTLPAAKKTGKATFKLKKRKQKGKRK